MCAGLRDRLRASDDRHDLPVQPAGVVFIGSTGAAVDAGVRDGGDANAPGDAVSDAAIGDARTTSDARTDAAILDAPSVTLDAF